MITEASPILNLLLAKGVGTKTLSDVLSKLVVLGVSPDDVGITVLADILQLRDEMTTNLLAVQAQAESLAEELEQQGIRILIRGFGEYPKKLLSILGKNAPPVLFAKGNVALLDSKGVGFCGSRHASEKGIHVARESARLLGDRSVNVVSGYAKGVDLAAHCASLEGGGTTTIVLAEGILHFRPKREIKSLLNPENHVVVSEYTPRLPWAARQAMQRNQTIIGLSDAMIVIESGTTGGTFACAESALRLKHPLFVVEYAVPAESAGGNQQFLEQGAQALRGDRHGRPNLSRVYEALGLTTAANVADAIEVCSSPEPSVSTPISNLQQPAEQLSEHPVDQRGYPKRLIEVDLPIARISAHARREKSIRHGHISTLHIWWARRPLAACRAVICAALWPDPADPLCPPAFRTAAVEALTTFAKRVNPERVTEEKHQLQATLSEESRGRWEALAAGTLTLNPDEANDMPVLRMALLDLIADFANWDNSTVPAYLETSRVLTQVAHESLGGIPGTRPLVVDPFAGGGSIPLEALRVGADAFASDLNPIPVLLNKVVLEYIPKFGERLADEVLRWGKWVESESKTRLEKYYQSGSANETLSYIWARTILCEGPGCGAELPLIRSLVMAKTGRRSVAIKLIPKSTPNRVELLIVQNAKPSEIAEGTVRRGTPTCPCCGYTTPLPAVKRQLVARHGGASDARLVCVVERPPGTNEQTYRLPTDADFRSAELAKADYDALQLSDNANDLFPNESTSEYHSFVNRGPIYGMNRWSDYFSPRQLVVLNTFAQIIRDAGNEISKVESDEFASAVETLLALALDKCIDYSNAVVSWMPRGTVGHLFARQAIPMTWDFPEANLISDFHCAWSNAYAWPAEVVRCLSLANLSTGHAERVSATDQVLPNDAASALVTDPPYYYSVQYSDLSDFFYVWLKRTVGHRYGNLFSGACTPKSDEIIVQSPGHEFSSEGKNNAYFEQRMAKAMLDSLRVLAPSGIGIVVFAHTSTAGWESQLSAMIKSGWTITGSWPIDTERAARTLALNRSVLASSVHLVCRPREDENGRLTDSVGEWRDVLGELPKRIHEWMPRLAAEGVVGADAIFACLGPALEIFSRYSRVEKANGETATLREYLEHVWGAVSTEALSLIFKDANAAGLEPDARLSAMWLWTIGGGSTNGSSGKSGDSDADDADESTDDDDEASSGSKGKATGGFILEYDAARKIAQGLGVHLEQCESLVEVKGDKARLLPVAERTTYLFGKGTQAGTSGTGRRKKVQQKTLFAELDEAEAAEAGWTSIKGPPPGTTVLDRVHQAMILFAANRGELLKRFLVDDGVGKDARFWKLADNLNKLYPSGTDERRWVEGVLARKKGLGL